MVSDRRPVVPKDDNDNREKVRSDVGWRVEDRFGHKRVGDGVGVVIELICK